MEEQLSKIADFLGMIFTTLEQTKIQQERNHKELMDALSNIQESLNEKKSAPTSTIARPINSSSEKKIAIPHEFQELVNKRKHAFYNKTRSEGIHKIYSEFISKPEPIIPRKFKEKSIPGQTEAHSKRLQLLEVEKMKVELERLLEQVHKQESILKAADETIQEIANKYNDPEDKRYIMDTWYKQIKLEEETSIGIWEKRKNFFINNISISSNDNESINPKPNFIRNNQPKRNLHAKSPQSNNEGFIDLEDMIQSFTQALQSMTQSNLANFTKTNKSKYKK